MEHWKFPVDALTIAILLHDPKCNPNEKINKVDKNFTHKTYSGILCKWDRSGKILALLTWRGLLDTNQAVSEVRILHVGRGNNVLERIEKMDLHDLAGTHQDKMLVKRYKQNPDQVRKECRMKFDICRQHDSATVFVQILLLSNNYFVVAQSSE